MKTDARQHLEEREPSQYPSITDVLKTRTDDPDELNSIEDLPTYLDALLHGWLRTLTGLGITLVPAFLLLDWFMIPKDSRHLFPLFATVRFLTTAILVVQYMVIRKSTPSKWSFLHGYFFTFFVSSAIVFMTVQLGGFNTPYYAGLILVMIAVNLLLPWHGLHSTVNGLITVAMYLVANAVWGGRYDQNILINNMYFLCSTVIIASSINHVKFNLVQKEFFGRQELKVARDALWGEMEIAKRIQTALLPVRPEIPGFDVAAAMVPADEVGGDYYDILTTDEGSWVLIGDVSGHGVESGLIMMMAQTTAQSIIRAEPGIPPSHLISQLNGVLKDNIARLSTDRYMTLSALRIEGPELMFAGKHQDILVYRQPTGGVEAIPTDGAWVGIIDDMLPFLPDRMATLRRGDIMLLFTDGIPEAMNESGDMFTQERMVRILRDNASDSADEIVKKIIAEASEFQVNQDDDFTLVVIRKTS